MLRLLFRLWWLQQRRNFHKRDAFVACYIIFLYVVMGVSFFLSFTENGGELGGEDMPALLGAGIVVGMLIPDIIMKMVMKRDITAMDDYVKSRPVPEKIWNKFLLTTKARIVSRFFTVSGWKVPSRSRGVSIVTSPYFV